MDGGKDTAMRERERETALLRIRGWGLGCFVVTNKVYVCVAERERDGGERQRAIRLLDATKIKTLKHKGRTEQKLLRERIDNRTRNVPEGIHERRSDRANARNRRH